MRDENSKKLGQKLRKFREAKNKQITDVSEAVELDADKLEKIEAGQLNLEEETLALLISHLDLSNKQATELWNIAGYDTIDLESISMNNEDSNDKKEIRINLPSDLKVLYSDMVQVSSNKYGVVINFIQSAPGGNATVVNRIGMSKEHAESFIQTLQKNIEKS